jgi:hypothetical protein
MAAKHITSAEGRSMDQEKAQQEISQADIEFTINLLRQNESAKAIQDLLVARGMSEEHAGRVLDEAYLRALYADAIALLNQGHTPNSAKQALTENGASPQLASAVVDDILAQHQATQPKGLARRIILGSLGGIVFVIGVGLFIGNRSGAFPTFPMAGYITMAIGAAIFAAAR